MPDYTYILTVTADTQDDADTVVRERIECDEEYGFTYRIDAVSLSHEVVIGLDRDQAITIAEYVLSVTDDTRPSDDERELFEYLQTVARSIINQSH